MKISVLHGRSGKVTLLSLSTLFLCTQILSTSSYSGAITGHRDPHRGYLRNPPPCYLMGEMGIFLNAIPPSNFKHLKLEGLKALIPMSPVRYVEVGFSSYTTLKMSSFTSTLRYTRMSVEMVSVKQGFSVSTTTVLRQHKPSELIFYDDFTELDTSVWERVNAPSGWKNGEFQKYSDSPENSYVRDGILYIRPTYINEAFDFEQLSDFQLSNNNVSSKIKRKINPKDETFEPIISARLNTREAFAFKYGRLEVSAKVPEGDWIWPAIWLLPQQYWYGIWPTSGEIDLMECRGNKELFSGGEDIGSNQFGSTLHFGINRTTDMWRLAHFKRHNNAGWNSGFHTYGMIWSPEEFVFTIDGEVLGIVSPPGGGFWEMGNFTDEKIWSDNKISPFDQPFHIVLNVAVGGTFGYWPDNTLPKKKPWTNRSPTALLDFWEARDEWQSTWKDEESALQIDYVKIWAL